MATRVRRTGWSLALRLGVALTALGGICIVASVLIAFLIADHSSSDSSPSSLTAIGLGGLGLLSVLLGAVVFTGVALAQLWRRGRRLRTAHPAGGNPVTAVRACPAALLSRPACGRRPLRHGQTSVIAAEAENCSAGGWLPRAYSVRWSAGGFGGATRQPSAGAAA
jgi:hypothetical protein